jgi:hypothetical protein
MPILTPGMTREEQTVLKALHHYLANRGFTGGQGRSDALNAAFLDWTRGPDPEFGRRYARYEQTEGDAPVPATEGSASVARDAEGVAESSTNADAALPDGRPLAPVDAEASGRHAARAPSRAPDEWKTRAPYPDP